MTDLASRQLSYATALDRLHIAAAATMTPVRRREFFSLRRVGGITFLRIGRLNLSWCVSREVQS